MLEDIKKDRLICFNTSYVSVQEHLAKKGVFLVLGFNTSYVSVQATLSQTIKTIILSFNTSYVSVQGGKNFPNLICFFVSIHPMCRFKAPLIKDGDIVIEFQYILCVGSRKLWSGTKAGEKSFNTSYVSVQV